MSERYRKKPVVIDAAQWDGSEESQRAIVNWSNGQIEGWTSDKSPSGYCLRIFTLEGVMEAHPGDWIIRGVKGEWYPCKPDIFEAIYERVVDSPNPEPVDVVRGPVGEPNQTTCPTCRTNNEQGWLLNDYDERFQCPDPWHTVNPEART